MKYWLKDFEHNISPATWEAADSLAQSGAVRNLREIETHFWVARVDTEDGSYETEAVITPHKIKAYSCECFTPGRRLMCVHVAASLLKIRQFLDQRAEARRAREAAAQPETMSRITVQSVLENAEPGEIQAFIKDYARRDRDFVLALKTWFAGSVTESENPYMLVLDSVFPKNTPAKGYRDPEFRRVRKALDGLEVQLNMAAGDGNLRAVFQISAAILTRTLPLMDKTEGNRRDALLHFCRLALEKIAEISERHLSLELRDAAWQLIFDLGVQGLIPSELQRDALRFLSESGPDAEKNERIRSRFDETPHPAPAFLLELYLCSLALKKMPEAVPKVLDDFVEMPEMVYNALLQLYYLKHWDAVLKAGLHFLPKKLFGAKQQREIEDVLLYVVEKTGDRARQTELLEQRFVKTGNLEVFRKMKDSAGDGWPALRERLLTDLSANGQINILAAAMAADAQWTELAQLLEKQGNITLLQRYESHYLPDQESFVRRQYVSLLSEYLQQHFGAPAATHVRQKLGELAQKGQLELVIDISRDLLQLFPERQALPEELAELLPKARRKILLTPSS